MYQQVTDPVGDSLGLSVIFAVVPLITLFVLLGGLKWAAHWSALTALAASLIVAIAVYSVPVGQAFDSALLGAVFGLFPIMWIVWNAIWIYNMTEATGHFAVLRRSFGRISDDQRVQAVIIAFCFGALLEALAGFGTPVAITAVMLIALGFQPIKAAAVALVANTAPVAFGAIAIPIITLGEITGLPKEDLGAMVGRQTPLLALFVPLILVGMVDGMRGVRQTWPAAVVGGFVFAIAQFACSNYISVELTDIVASLLATGAIVALLQVWQPSEPIRGERFQRGGPAIAGAAVADPAMEAEIRRKDDDHKDTKGEIAVAYAPYLIIIAIFGIAQIGPVKTFLTDLGSEFTWPGLDIRTPDGEAVSSTTFKFNWATAAGSLLLVAGLLTMLVLKLSPGRALKVYGRTLKQLKWATLTVASVLAHRVRDEPVGPDDHARPVDRRRRRDPRLPVVDHRLDRRRGHRLGHELELAVRRAAGLGGEGGRPRPDAARGGELVRRRAREDDLAAEPGHRRGRRRPGRARGRAVQARGRLEHRAAADHVRARLPAVDEPCCPGWSSRRGRRDGPSGARAA